MPEDVLHGRPPFLRDGHNFHLRLCEREQRSILFEDEEHELMSICELHQRTDQREEILGDPSLTALDDGGSDADAKPLFRQVCALRSRKRRALAGTPTDVRQA